MATGFDLRAADSDDYDAVVAFTRETWADRDATDYIPEVYHDWIAGDPDRTYTVVADAGEDIAGICQCVLLSGHEAWAQGMRVNPAYRDAGLSGLLNDAVFEWARERGASVCRNMVFSWNAAGLGGSRAGGFDPVTEFRWAHPNPDAEAETGTHRVTNAPNVAWGYWQRSDARAALRGLTLDMDESWAVAELTPETLRRAADETRVFALADDDGARGMAYRVRESEREVDGETERWAEYGVGAWADPAAARALFGAISADAAELGADQTRVLIPETPRHVSGTAVVRVAFSDDPDFVLEADLA